MPFREAHAVIGRLVLHCIKENKALLELTLPELKAFSPMFESDVFEALSLHACVDLRNIPGGPAPEAVQASIDAGKAWLEGFSI